MFLALRARGLEHPLFLPPRCSGLWVCACRTGPGLLAATLLQPSKVSRQRESCQVISQTPVLRMKVAHASHCHMCSQTFRVGITLTTLPDLRDTSTLQTSRIYHVYVVVSQSCLTVLTPWTVACSSVWNSPGKNTGVDCQSLLRGSSQPRGQTPISHIIGRSFTISATRKPKSTIDDF